MLAASWNVGWEISTAILVILSAIGIGFTILCAVSRFWPGMWTGVGWTALFGIIMLVVAFPFSGVYHRYQPISGEITQNVSSRFLADGNGGTDQNYLVYIKGNPYMCDDTRCSNLHKGEDVTLMCEKSFQFNAVSGWVCNWGKLGLNA
jgi:hypothetical protein